MGQYVPQYFEADRMTDSKQMQAIEGAGPRVFCLLADRLTNLNDRAQMTRVWPQPRNC